MNPTHQLQARLDALGGRVLSTLRRGIEKESLRVRPDGMLATTPHARALGSALTHPHITTDFSESQLELITGVHDSVASCLGELELIHQVVYRQIGDEVMWCGSMPCYLPSEDAIPIAQFGNSNLGRAKTVYRIGLSHRYGRRMQLISGLHYNFSLAEESWPMAGFGEANEAYFSLIRNFRRHGWLLLYLFGASPAVCSSFVEGREHTLQELAAGTLYLPHATSLRMGRLGYLSATQDALAVSYNDLASYAASLEDALVTPYPAYETIGIREGDEYRQLATTLLQIENEFYSTIRPKRVGRSGERPLRSLRTYGVQYIEVRAMDLDPFSAIGITARTARFLDIFLLHCLLCESPPDSPQEIAAIGRNKQRVAASGRAPGLTLERDEAQVELREWARQLLAECAPVATALDRAQGGTGYREALAGVMATAADPDTLPSARMLREIQEQHRGSYFNYILDQSRRHRSTLLAVPLSPGLESRFRDLARDSLAEQQTIEGRNELSFETYRQQYLAPESLRVE
ncbi:MAG: glutamate--cysteine ligase [Casimicrobiaceae bacterium]